MRWATLTIAGVVGWSCWCVRTQDRESMEPTNVVAGHLDGTWSRDVELCDRLGASEETLAISFRKDLSVENSLPSAIAETLKVNGMFSCGEMTLDGDKSLFALTQVAGCPYILYPPTGPEGDPVDGMALFSVSIAVGSSRKNDILFVGGSLDDKPFEAYGRAK